MSGISSTTGLVSGIDMKSIIDQLMTIEARPKLFQQRTIARLSTQQAALQEINAKLSVFDGSVGSLADSKTYKATTASSSNEGAATITSTSAASPGTYNLTVNNLVNSQQMLTRGFADDTSTPVGAGTFSFEFGDGRLDSETNLSRLNGGAGVQRGKIEVADRAGNSAVVDLSRALTVDDVVTAINETSGINVTASVEGDGLVITDNSGGAGTLSVQDVGSAGTTASLGLDAAAAGDTLTGNQINTVTTSTLLSTLNDGNGVRTVGTADFRITDSLGNTHDVNLSEPTDLGDVIDAINDAAGGAVTAAVGADGVSLELTDNAGGGGNISVAALNGSNAAEDLGIAQSSAGAITGDRLVAEINSKLLGNLKGGAGVSLGTIGITDRSGAVTNVDLSTAQSVDGVLDLINNSGAGVTASLNSAGNGIALADTTDAAAADLEITDVSGTSAADLGLLGTHNEGTADGGNLQMRWLSESTLLSKLNGGAGISRGLFRLTDSDGDSATVDLTQGNETTLEHVIDEINSRGLNINARINDNGDGLILEDTGSGTFALKVEEEGSTTARDLGILGEAKAPGDDLDGSYEKTLELDGTESLQDVKDAINNASLGITATIVNDGSEVAPYRLSLVSKDAGLKGRFVFDDGGLDMQADTLSKAENATVFYGSTDPAKAVVVRSSSNTLSTLINGATIELVNPSTAPVQLSISRDNSQLTGAIADFVKQFNGVITTLDKHDSYDAETEERGALLGDNTLARVRSGLYSVLNRNQSDISSQYTMLSQIGVSITEGAKLEFDQAKFEQAMQTDPEAVERLLTLKETEEVDGETEVTNDGVIIEFQALLDRLTDSVDGTMALRTDAIDEQIELANQRIVAIDEQLASKRERLELQFINMEKALADIQQQGSAMGQIAPLQTPGQ